MGVWRVAEGKRVKALELRTIFVDKGVKKA
jgi:hypothetical protein